MTSPEEEVNRILARFEQTWTFDLRDLNRPSSEQLLRDLIKESPPFLHARLEDEFFGAGPLTSLLTREDLQELVINGPHQIWYEQNGVFAPHDDRFLSAVTFKNFIDRLCAEATVKLDLEHPFADGRWRGFRLHLACAPLANQSFHVTLRRVPDNPWTLERLEAVHWCTPVQRAHLQTLLAERRNFLIVGPTGCGKTSVLGACLKALAENERVVIIEDTDELATPNAASTKLLTRPAVAQALREVTLTDLVKQSLRMRPFRLVVGEVRGGEAKDLLLALATGHDGSLGTLHASDARQALLRLEMLIQMGAPQWNLQAIRQLLHLSVEYLVVCANHAGQRRLEGIYRVAALESFGFCLERVN